nr:hypothetical protein CFP56_46323 [Quercus suber]
MRRRRKRHWLWLCLLQSSTSATCCGWTAGIGNRRISKDLLRSELEVNDHKRHYEITCSDKKIPKDILSVLVDKTVGSIFGSSREVAGGNGDRCFKN